MEKKETFRFTATLIKNTDKGGGWSADVLIMLNEMVVEHFNTAWKTSSPAKRWIKSVVLSNTPRKNIKWESSQLDEKGKPTVFKVFFTYTVKVEE
jgi:hypothetical protein